MKKRITGMTRLLAMTLVVEMTLCFLPGKDRFLIPVRAENSDIAETRQNVKLLEEELILLKGSSESASKAYEDALKQYEEAAINIEKAMEAKTALDREVSALEREIEATRTLLGVYNEQILVYSDGIEEKQKEMDECRERFLTRIRTGYEDSFVSYLEIILSSDSFADFLYHLDIVASLLDYDQRVLESLDRSQKELISMQNTYQTMQYKAKETLDSLSARMPELEEKQKRSTELLAELDARLLELKNNRDASEEEKARLAEELAKKEQRLADEEAALEKKIREEQERLRLEAEEKRRKEEEERKRLEEERKRKEEEERRQREEEERRRAEENAKAGVTGPEPEEEPERTPEPVNDPPKQEVPADNGTYIWPVSTSYARISSVYGYRTNPLSGKAELHNGIDIPAPYKSNIYASRAGTVIIADWHNSYGNYVVIDHGDGISTLYAHNTSLLVSVGDVVAQGDVIALCGTTGNSQGYHCHFCVRVNGVPVQPLDYVSQP